MFEKATRLGFRYPSVRGALTTEDLWKMSLESTNDFNLDAVAVELDEEVSKLGSKSFVKKATTDTRHAAERLDIVKHIIAIKVKAKEAAALAKDKKAKREKILNLIADKQDEELKGKSQEDLLKELAELED